MYQQQPKQPMIHINVETVAPMLARVGVDELRASTVKKKAIPGIITGCFVFISGHVNIMQSILTKDLPKEMIKWNSANKPRNENVVVICRYTYPP